VIRFASLLIAISLLAPGAQPGGTKKPSVSRPKSPPSAGASQQRVVGAEANAKKSKTETGPGFGSAPADTGPRKRPRRDRSPDDVVVPLEEPTRVDPSKPLPGDAAAGQRPKRLSPALASAVLKAAARNIMSQMEEITPESLTELLVQKGHPAGVAAAFDSTMALIYGRVKTDKAFTRLSARGKEVSSWLYFLGAAESPDTLALPPSNTAKVLSILNTRLDSWAVIGFCAPMKWPNKETGGTYELPGGAMQVYLLDSPQAVLEVIETLPVAFNQGRVFRPVAQAPAEQPFRYIVVIGTPTSKSEPSIVWIPIPIRRQPVAGSPSNSGSAKWFVAFRKSIRVK
jgi:hypothetical protein